MKIKIFQDQTKKQLVHFLFKHPHKKRKRDKVQEKKI